MKNLLNVFYGNIGKKLKGLAVVCGIIGILALVAGLVYMIVIAIDQPWHWRDMLIIGVIIAGSGIVLFISTWSLYAFGQITDDMHNGINRAISETKNDSGV